MTENSGITLNSYIAQAGICSRRKAVEIIQNGQVRVNNNIITEPSYRVQPSDSVMFNGSVLSVKKKTYILLNKPKGYISTVSDEKGRKTILDLVDHLTTERLYPVGRLDRATTGLILLTNDGNFAQKLAHPKYNVAKVYCATLHKHVQGRHLDMLIQGIQLEDGAIAVKRAEYVNQEGTKIEVEISSGRNKIVRRMFEHLGYEVLKLDRNQYSFLTKQNLMQGGSRFLNQGEINALIKVTN